MWMLKPPGVYSPQADTALLADAVRRDPRTPGAAVLDVGTGTGALAITAAACGAARVEAVDLSRRAVLAARFNARLYGHEVRVRRGDLLAPVTGRRFDLIVANPPYVPAPSAAAPRHGRARAWNAGPHGRAMLDRLCCQAPVLLDPGGVLLLVHSALSGVRATLERLRSHGLAARVADRRTIALGPVLRERARWLTARGLLEPGARTEELVVIRALRPA